MRQKIKALIFIAMLALCKRILKNTGYCIFRREAARIAEEEAEYLLRYAEISGNLGYRTRARKKVRNSAQRTLDALRIPLKPSPKFGGGGREESTLMMLRGRTQ